MEETLDPQVVITWLQKCSKNSCSDCYACPYNLPDYEEGCGKLLADAARLLALAYPAEVPEQERTCKNCSKVCIADGGGWTEAKKGCQNWEQRKFY